MRNYLLGNKTQRNTQDIKLQQRFESFKYRDEGLSFKNSKEYHKVITSFDMATTLNPNLADKNKIDINTIEQSIEYNQEKDSTVVNQNINFEIVKSIRINIENIIKTSINNETILPIGLYDESCYDIFKALC